MLDGIMMFLVLLFMISVTRGYRTLPKMIYEQAGLNVKPVYCKWLMVLVSFETAFLLINHILS